MGGSSISSSSMKDYYSSRSSTWDTASDYRQIFKSSRMLGEFNPAVMKLPREALDSAESPKSKAIIFAEDFSGSMGRYTMSLITKEFPRLITQIYEKVSYNPHICFMGVGDVEAGDEAPLQVTQFETDLRMLDQLQKLYIEGAGGGNNSESYILPWYFASNHVKMDCWDKRREKGFLFTFGDEMPTPRLTKGEIESVFGNRDTIQVSALSKEDCYEMASEKFYCYHIILHGSYYNGHSHEVESVWTDLMGTHVVNLEDHQYLPELVSTILNMYEGYSKSDAIDAIQNSVAKWKIENALKNHEEYVENVCESEGSSDNIELF